MLNLPNSASYLKYESPGLCTASQATQVEHLASRACRTAATSDLELRRRCRTPWHIPSMRHQSDDQLG
jgi:hypothetical protein